MYVLPVFSLMNTQSQLLPDSHLQLVQSLSYPESLMPAKSQDRWSVPALNIMHIS